MFQFGNLQTISAGIGTISFISVVLFLVVFEYIVSCIDYFKDSYPASFQMIQKVYKELMIMGFLSFTIIIVESVINHNTSADWITSIDFAHILLFFTALFLVFHACILIFFSNSLAVEYQHTHFMKISNILQQIKLVRDSNNTIAKFLYEQRYIPGSALRRTVEFKIIHVLFRDTFSLPHNFNFGCYLTGCHEKYSLELLDIGVFSWFILIVCAGLNILRIYVMNFVWNDCHSGITTRRLLPSMSDVSSAIRSLTGHDDPSVTSQIWEERKMRYLSATSAPVQYSEICNARVTDVFIVCGLALCIWVAAVLIIARIYELRYISI